MILLLIFSSAFSYSQDTTKSKQDTTKPSLKFILSENKYSYLNPSNPDTISRNRILWYPLKSIDNVFDYLPGYYLRLMDIGQVNQLTFNQLDHSNTAVLRSGRLINDLIDGSIDLNLLSRNEIAEIELSNGYGNSVYNYINNVNVITRQLFQSRPYTEIAFWQDRYENTYLDAYFSQNFFKGFNFNFGITKHSYDGKYRNSDFDKWLGRFNFNLAPSKYLNFFLYTNYAKIQRGLNEGIDPDTVDISSRETLFNPALAVVKNSDAYEIKERFDIDGGAVFKKGISFTKLQLYVSNSFRKYRDEENRPNPNGITVKDNFHWINYGVRLEERLELKIFRQLKISSNSQIEIDDRIRQANLFENVFAPASNSVSDKSTVTSVLEDAALSYKGLTAGGYARGLYYHGSNVIYIYAGANANYKYNFDSLSSLQLSLLTNSLKEYFSVSASCVYDKSFLKAEFYTYKRNNPSLLVNELTDDNPLKGINVLAGVKFYPLDLEINFTHNITTLTGGRLFPENSGNVIISFHNTGIKNKLEYKIGFNTRFWGEFISNRYIGRGNSFTGEYNFDSVKVPANATLDIFIMGKIGRASFGLTFENILDRLIYNTGVYPQIDRGGLFNAWSRFNITWNFFD